MIQGRGRGSAGGRHALRVAALTLLAVAVVGCGTAPAPSAPSAATDRSTPAPSPVPAPASEIEDEPGPEVAPVPAGDPTRVVIPAIDVDAELVPVGLDEEGAMAVPDFGLAGWYTEGPAPGHPGPAAIAAHVDSRAGPDVFFRLRELAPGDEVRVSYDSGDEVTFVVQTSEQAPKDELPGDRIWPVTGERLLTLITCGGDFDRGVRSYRDNVIVYTELLGG
jgi:sortase (surface protein transpeptidase)